MANQEDKLKKKLKPKQLEQLNHLEQTVFIITKTTKRLSRDHQKRD